MLFYPKNLRFKKFHSRLPQNTEIEIKSVSIKLQHGTFGLKTLESGHISAKQIEASRRIIIRALRKSIGSKLWIMIFPFVSVTRKPKEVRMGKGKGNHFEWVAAVKKGKILFEVVGLSEKTAVSVLNHVITKLGLKTIIVRND